MTTNTELLRTIQDGAVSSVMPVAELLRRCQVLATRLKVRELAAWVQYELNGYPYDAELPSYRLLPGIAMGHFTGPFGSGIRNGILPASNLPEKLRHWAQQAQFRQPIATLEEISEREKDDHVRCAWPGDLVALVQGNFYQNMALAQAWLSVSRGSVVGVVNTVRNRILTFALEAEALVEPERESSPVETSGALSHVFNTVIYGNVGNLAQGSAHFSQVSGIQPGDLEGLLRELSQLGVPVEDTQELREAVEVDGPVKEGKLGSRVASWVGKMIGKAMAGTWQVARTTATTVLPQLIAKYYNLPT